MKRIFMIIVVGLGALFLLVQLVPYGRQNTNPPVVAEPAWNAPQTRDLAARACFDCHSNETVWPWYSNIAPLSWLVQHDVVEGRERLNFSEWGQRRQETDDLFKVIESSEMPPQQFLILHPEARLTTAEKQLLIQGFQATLGNAGEDGEGDSD